MNFEIKRLRAWLLLLLVFVAGFAGGIVATRVAVRHLVQRALSNPTLIRVQVERRLALKLRLDAGQRAKVDGILANTQAEIKSLRSEFQPRFLQILGDTRTQILAALTPEQRARFEKLQRENPHWWQPR
jgi:hypothetical protein